MDINLYQSEGSGRTVRIFLTGLIGLFAVFFVVIKQAFAITVLSVVPIALLALGFAVRRRKSLVAVVPPLSDKQPRFATERVGGQPYPQAVLYRIRLRNLYLLLIPIGISGSLVALVMGGVIKDYGENPIPLYGALAALFIASLSALGWLNECRWVARAVGTYAIFDDGSAILLLCAPESPEAGPAAVGCRYHRFDVVDVRHVTEDELRAATPGTGS